MEIYLTSKQVSKLDIHQTKAIAYAEKFACGDIKIYPISALSKKNPIAIVARLNKESSYKVLMSVVGGNGFYLLGTCENNSKEEVEKVVNHYFEKRKVDEHVYD